MAGTDAWCGLIAETRQALAHLRVEDLEMLAEQAEAMLAECGGVDGIGAQIDGEDRAGLAAGHRLLGDLLRATDANLELLRRLRSGVRAEGGRQWVR